MNAIEIRNLTKTYPGFTLDCLNLSLPTGCILGLIGENGAGKSTTIKLILNMLHPDSGTVSVLGKETPDMEDLGVVMDDSGFPECLTAVQISKVMADIYRRWDSAQFTQLLEKLDIPTNKKYKEFSKGMKMKLSIAVALSHAPKLLILDEATSGLDPVIRDQVLDIFTDFTRDETHSVLISSHIVSDLEKVCDYIAFLHHGRLMLFEEKDALYEQYGLALCSKEDFAAIDPAAVKGKKESRYGIEAIVDRNLVPAGMKLNPIGIEELFIFMAKEEEK